MTNVTNAAASDSRAGAPRVGEFGMWVFIGSEVLFFGALLLTYAFGRAQWPEGFAAASRHTDVVLGTLNTAILLSSSACVAMAVEAHSANAPRLSSRLLAATAVLGIVFLMIKGIEYRKDWHEGLFPGPAFRLGDSADVPQGAQMFFAFYFLSTALHAIHVGIGIALMAALAVGSRRRLDWASGAAVTVAGLYWHFVDIVWIALYPLLYLVSRHS